jgi:ribosomal protein L29
MSIERPRLAVERLGNTHDIATTRRAKAPILYIEDLQIGRDSAGIKVEHTFRKQP